jgi:hypothetical protein
LSLVDLGLSIGELKSILDKTFLLVSFPNLFKSEPNKRSFSIVDKMQMEERYIHLYFFSELELSLEVKLALGFILFGNGDVLFNR